MSVVNDDFRTRIKLEMTKRGLTQKDLAEKLDVKPQYLSQVLKGEKIDLAEYDDLDRLTELMMEEGFRKMNEEEKKEAMIKKKEKKEKELEKRRQLAEEKRNQEEKLRLERTLEESRYGQK